MTSRRKFIKKLSALGAISALPEPFLIEFRKKNQDFIWAFLVHLSFNMWMDHNERKWGDLPADHYQDDDFDAQSCKDSFRWALGYRDFMTFDEPLWDDLIGRMKDSSINMVVLDLGDAVRYETHPEIAVKNAWSTQKLENEIYKLRDLGIEPIPKLNFSTTHDTWLGKYSRMVSTKEYYQVCTNLIKEVCEIFNKPRFFHLGMDEEAYDYQKNFQIAHIRNGDLWWNDLYFLLNEVEKNGSRPWVWSDYVWNHPDVFYSKMPLDVLQSNWYYGKNFDPENVKDKKGDWFNSTPYYKELDFRGFDQIPCGSNYSNDENFIELTKYCKEHLNSKRLLGFIQTTWKPILNNCKQTQREAIEQITYARKSFIYE